MSRALFFVFLLCGCGASHHFMNKRASSDQRAAERDNPNVPSVPTNPSTSADSVKSDLPASDACCPEAHSYRESDNRCVPNSGAPCAIDGSGCDVPPDTNSCANGTIVTQQLETNKIKVASDEECFASFGWSKSAAGVCSELFLNCESDAPYGHRTKDECEKPYSCAIFSGIDRQHDHCTAGADETQCNVIAGCRWLPTDYSGPYPPEGEVDTFDPAGPRLH